MAGDNELIHYIRAAVRAGESANQAFRTAVGTTVGIRRADFLSLYRQVRDDIERQSTGIDRPGNRRPYQREVVAMFTVVETGFMQHLDIWVKDRETGEIYPRPFSIRTDDLLTHDDAISTALEAFGEHADTYGETILGASYRSTYELIPQGK